MKIANMQVRFENLSLTQIFNTQMHIHVCAATLLTARVMYIYCVLCASARAPVQCHGLSKQYAQKMVQSTLVISTSIISNNRLPRGEIWSLF